jgi:hypothetical protein
MVDPDDVVEPVGAAYAAELHKLGTFGVVVDDQVVRLDQLSALELAGVQRATGIPWPQLLQQPTEDLLGAIALIEACEAHAGVEQRSAAGQYVVAELLQRVVRVAPALEVVPGEVG